MRHLLYRLGGTSALSLVKRARSQPSEHLAGAILADRFAVIHRNRVWSADGSVNDPGSDAGATAAVQVELARLARDLGVSRLTAIGCGDFGWIKGVEGDFRYCGVDIVPDLITGHARTYGNSTRRFLHLDAARDALPSGDVVFCREVLFHLSFADGLAMLRNLRSNDAAICSPRPMAQPGSTPTFRAATTGR